MHGKATRIRLMDFSTPQMRAFHMSWFAFFLCFFAWFGIAPLMPVVRAELKLTQSQIGNIMIASVAMTVVARLFIGWLLDRIGPRIAYTWLLIVGSIPVMGIGLAHDYQTFLLFRLAIGMIGASFVITQYHASVMFAPNCIGSANALTAGWGNLGGGVAQVAMPFVMASFVAFGFTQAMGWRLAMVVAGACCMAMGVAYYLFTQDAPEGNFKALRAAGKLPRASQAKGAFAEACCDWRVWALFLIYGACFGVELTIHNIASLYFTDRFGLSVKTAGMMAAIMGLMNIFARALGGWFGDRAGARWGLGGRVRVMFLVVLCEGIMLMLFSRMTALAPAVAALLGFSLFVNLSTGATYAVVPFINRRALGAVSGIVGAGGNVGAVAAGFLFKGALSYSAALLIIGALVCIASFASAAVGFSTAEEKAHSESAEPLPAGAAA